MPVAWDINMLRFAACYALSLTTALLFVMLLIRLQPPRYSDLPDSLIVPQTCSLPCFMGIQPGQSTALEAVTLLALHEWVTDVTDQTSYAALNEPASSGLNGEITWSWSGSQPDWIDPSSEGWLWVSRNEVQSMNVTTRLRLGDIRLLFGLPDLEVVLFTERTTTPKPARVNYRAGYLQGDLIFSTLRNCPLNDLWKSPVLLRVVHGLAASQRINSAAIIYREC